MPKVLITVTLDADVLSALRARAARVGRGCSELIEDVLRRDLGFDVLERLWAANDLDEQEAASLAVEAQHETRLVN
ncbi:MAG: ribbon-helix-helix protein, CopG family [Actinobacteria bacterium]|nr:ribbon-helix-helix protein, CopG family [Actinomycetota bacterium]